MSLSECSQGLQSEGGKVYLTTILWWGRVVNDIKNAADGGDNVVVVETGEAIDPWPDIDFN